MHLFAESFRFLCYFFFSSRRRHTRYIGDWSSDVCSSDLDLLSPHYSPVPRYWDEHPLTSEIDEIACGSFRHREPPEIEGTGYVVKSLEAALWAFHRGGSFQEGCLMAVNLGDDADTTEAVYGQLAGA